MDLKVIQKKLSFYCAYQERAQREVEEKLKNYNLSLNQKQIILQWLKENDFLNESRFAKSFSRSKLFNKGWGKKKIDFMLKLKGVETSLIKEAWKEISPIEYKEKLTYLIEKKTKNKKLDFIESIKIINFFKNKGFEEVLIREILQNKESNFL